MATATRQPRQRLMHPDTNFPFYPDVVLLKHCERFAYQRKPSNVKKKIEHDFKPELAGVLTLSKRSNTLYAIVDGGTRHAGMTARGMTEWVAIVFEGLTEKDEARMFADLVRERRGMHSAESYNADLCWEEPITMAIEGILKRLGFEVGKGSNKPEVISAPAALRNIYLGVTSGKHAEEAAMQEGGGYPDLLVMTLEVIKGAWPELTSEVKSRVMLPGLATFLLKEKIDVDQERLVTRLKYTNPAALWQVAQRAAEGDRKSVTSDKPGWMAHAIGSLYHQKKWKPGVR